MFDISIRRRYHEREQEKKVSRGRGKGGKIPLARRTKISLFYRILVGRLKVRKLVAVTFPLPNSSLTAMSKIAKIHLEVNNYVVYFSVD